RQGPPPNREGLSNPWSHLTQHAGVHVLIAGKIPYPQSAPILNHLLHHVFDRILDYKLLPADEGDHRVRRGFHRADEVGVDHERLTMQSMDRDHEAATSCRPGREDLSPPDTPGRAGPPASEPVYSTPPGLPLQVYQLLEHFVRRRNNA